MADISNDIILRGKVAAFSTLIAALTNQAPAVEYFPEYVAISFSPEQRAILQGKIEQELKAKPGAIRINYNSIFIPPVMRVYGKYAIMLLVIAFLLGRITK